MTDISTEPEVANEPVGIDDSASGVSEEVVDNNSGDVVNVDIENMTDEEFDEYERKLLNKTDGSEESSDTDSKDSDSDDDSGKDDDSLNDLEVKYKQQLEKGFEVAEPVIIKVNGTVTEIKDPGDIRSLIEKGLSYTQKTQELAKYRDTLSVLNEVGINDAETLRQVLRGEALVDANAIDNTGSNMVQENIDPREKEVNQVAEQILSSPKANEMKSIIGSLPDSAKSILQSDARVLAGLYKDVESGFAQKVIPLVNKYMTVNDMGFIEAYIQAGNDISGNSVVGSKAKRKALESEPRGRGVAKAKSYTEDDIFNMSEEEFEKFEQYLLKNKK